ncbi:MAG: DNA lyase [Phototrophicales bacterium]|nr:MAG: DNA lyase [Phototrophicales bacterium]RMG72173.1 MAG: endonuclease III [Chloroflexota bacterium]
MNDFERRKAKYQPVAQILRDVYGELTWHPGQSAMDELVSCILSQNTNDTNRDKAFAALKARYPDWQAVVDAPTDDLIETIRSAGLANQKAPRIQRALERIYRERGEYNIDFLNELPLDEARDWLISIDGVGPKTAAIVLCFAFNRPAFPVDTHVHRVGKRIGFLPENISAEKAHPFMEAIVPPEDHYAFHIYLIRHGRDTCRARNPMCARCPLKNYCDDYQSTINP